MGTARVYVRGVRLRLVQLYGGLVLYGVSSSLLVLANLGLDPWDVFHQGLSRTFGLAIGWLLGGTVGVGTVVYALAIGPLAHVFVPLFSHGRPTPEGALEAV